MPSKTWGEIAGADWPRVERELLDYGLDARQVAVLRTFRGVVSEQEMVMMRELPPNPRTGRRPTIHSVRGILRTLRVLGLTEKVRR